MIPDCRTQLASGVWKDLNFHPGSHLIVCTFRKTEYAILILNLINENFPRRASIFPSCLFSFKIFYLELLINVLLFISDGASNSSPQIPSSRIRKSKSLFLPIKNISNRPANTRPDDKWAAEWSIGTKQKTSFVWVWRKVFIENFMNALFDIWYQSSGPGYEMSQIWVSMIADALPPGALSKLNCTHIEGVIPHLCTFSEHVSVAFQIYLRPEAVFAASFASKYLPK